MAERESSIRAVERAITLLRALNQTIPYSPLSLLHSSINMRLSLVSRTLGRAYLAFCLPDEQEMLLEVVRQSHHPEDRLAQDREAVQRCSIKPASAGTHFATPPCGRCPARSPSQ
jgi:DNA-binding IclR family transcriptional regulator